MISAYITFWSTASNLMGLIANCDWKMEAVFKLENTYFSGYLYSTPLQLILSVISLDRWVTNKAG